MFDFLENDTFVIVLNIVFLLFIIYDFKKYQQTKQKQFLLNITLTLGFAIWTMIPFYNKYFTWSDAHIAHIDLNCSDTNQTLYNCMVDNTIKAYSYEDFICEDKNSSDYKAFVKDTLQACQEN